MIVQPLISVIIPVYNVESYLKDCMASVLCQTYSNLEVILVNDGSTDGSGKLCDHYAGLDSRVKVIHKENGGPMSAVLEGAGRATGDYLAFMDSDDWVDSVMIEELAEQLSGSDRELVCSNYLIEKKDQSIPMVQSMKPGVYGREEIEAEVIPFLLGQEVRRIHYSRCMKLISRKLVLDNLKHCNLRLTMGEDMNLILPCILDAERLAVVEKGLYYHYRFVDASLVHRYRPGLYEMINLLHDTLEKLLVEKIDSGVDCGNNGLSPEWRRRLKEEYLFLFFLVLKNELRGPAKGCAGRIQRMIRQEKIRKEMGNIHPEICGKANRLLYYIWENPSVARILTGRAAITVFDHLA